VWLSLEKPFNDYEKWLHMEVIDNPSFKESEDYFLKGETNE
jgi:hypothetical protein